MSPTEAGIRASKGAIQNPCTALAAVNDPKLVDSAAQKLDIASPSVVKRYSGRFPTLTAAVLQSKLPKAMATMQEPLHPGES